MKLQAVDTLADHVLIVEGDGTGAEGQGAEDLTLLHIGEGLFTRRADALLPVLEERAAEGALGREQQVQELFPKAHFFFFRG